MCESERETETEKQRQTETDRKREKVTERYRDGHRKRYRQRERKRKGETETARKSEGEREGGNVYVCKLGTPRDFLVPGAFRLNILLSNPSVNEIVLISATWLVVPLALVKQTFHLNSLHGG